MLVLSRKQDEAIVIGSDITVTILEIKGNQVRLGIQAPRETAVWRDEIAEAAYRNPPRPCPDRCVAGTL